MLLGPLLAQYEEALIAVGEEAESLSFAYRALKNWTFTDFVLALQKEVEAEDQDLLESIFEQLKHHIPAQYIIGSTEFCAANNILGRDVMFQLLKDGFKQVLVLCFHFFLQGKDKVCKGPVF